MPAVGRVEPLRDPTFWSHPRNVGSRENALSDLQAGWVRLTAGVAKDRAGNAMTVKLSGTVEPYIKGE